MKMEVWAMLQNIKVGRGGCLHSTQPSHLHRVQPCFKRHSNSILGSHSQNLNNSVPWLRQTFSKAWPGSLHPSLRCLVSLFDMLPAQQCQPEMLFHLPSLSINPLCFLFGAWDQVARHMDEVSVTCTSCRYPRR